MIVEILNEIALIVPDCSQLVARYKIHVAVVMIEMLIVVVDVDCGSRRGIMVIRWSY